MFYSCANKKQLMKGVTNCWSGVKTRSEHNVATINKKESVLLSQEMTLPTTKLSFVSLQWELLSMQFPKKSWIACHLVQFSNVKWCFHELSIPKIWQFLHQEFARFFYQNLIIVNYPNVNHFFFYNSFYKMWWVLINTWGTEILSPKATLMRNNSWLIIHMKENNHANIDLAKQQHRKSTTKDCLI